MNMSRHSLFISNFKKAAKLGSKCLVVCFVLVLFFWWVMPQYSGAYNAALVDKMERLKSISESKIVLIGDSNVAFGMDSEMLEEAMGMPVVNMGLHGGLGNPFHEEMARENVTEGDIYIICHTSYADTDSIPDSTLAWMTIENHGELWGLVRWQDSYNLLKGFPPYIKKCIGLWADGTGNQEMGGVYARSAFNEYGDVAVPRKESEYIFSKQGVFGINETTVQRLNELNKYLEDRGATMVVAGFPIGDGVYTPAKEEYEAAWEELKAELDCDVISDIEDYFFDYSFFYDTEYHLTDEGARLRTEQLIEDLKKWTSI